MLENQHDYFLKQKHWSVELAIRRGLATESSIMSFSEYDVTHHVDKGNFLKQIDQLVIPPKNSRI